VSTDPIALLDRQFERLSNLDGAQFIQEVRRFHEFLTTSAPPPVRDAVKELRAEADESSYRE